MSRADPVPHFLVRMRPGGEFSNEEIKRRFRLYYGDDEKREPEEKGIPALREKWGSLSEFVKDKKRGQANHTSKAQRHDWPTTDDSCTEKVDWYKKMNSFRGR